MYREIRAFVQRQVGKLIDAAERCGDVKLRYELLDMTESWLVGLNANQQKRRLSDGSSEVNRGRFHLQ